MKHCGLPVSSDLDGFDFLGIYLPKPVKVNLWERPIQNNTAKFLHGSVPFVMHVISLSLLIAAFELFRFWSNKHFSKII